jgi:putative membrane protein
MKRLLSILCCSSAICCLSISIAVNAQPKAGGKAGMTDQKFVDFAAQTNMVEANLGQLAQDSAERQDVKDYGKMLATDHTNDQQQLTAAAQQANLTVPNAIDEEHNKTVIGPYQKLKGAAFDHKYIADMIAGHTKAIEIYKKEAADAENPAIKSYAATALPVLQKHLDGAKDLEKNKGGMQGMK